jgi:effector-binding domain-containing protein
MALTNKTIEPMKTELNNMVRAYGEYLNAVGDFVNATDDQTRNKLIAFDIIEMLSVDLGEQIDEAYKVLTENNQ